MELRQLRYFLAVAERLNFSRAARDVHITQSTISHQIKQLERELGYELFERSLHHVRLTEQGEALLPAISRVLRDLDDAIRQAKAGGSPLKEHLKVLVGVHTFNSAVLPDALKRFVARCPEVSVEIDETLSSTLIPRFDEGVYDLAVGAEAAGAAFAFRPLCQEELILAVPPDHALAGRRRVRMVELHGERFALLSRSFSARAEIDRCFAAAGAEPWIVAEFDNPYTLYKAAAAQGLAAIGTHNFPEQARDTLVKVHLEDPTPLRTIGLYWRPDRALSPAAQILCDVVIDQIREASRRPSGLGLRPCKVG